MSELPTVPDEVYRAAMIASAFRCADLEGVDQSNMNVDTSPPGFRAAVKVAYQRGHTAGSDIVDAAIAYVTEPEGSDQVEHYWHQLKDAVGTYLKARDRLEEAP